MARNTCELRVGRLLEIRVSKGYRTPDDVDEMIRMIGEQAARLPADVKHVTVADWRLCQVMTEAACERATHMFMKTNPRTERSAILCDDGSPTAIWQFLRLVTTGHHRERLLFRRIDEMLAWLSEVLDDKERARLEEFIRESDPR
jgi:hypothetical protein